MFFDLIMSTAAAAVPTVTVPGADPNINAIGIIITGVGSTAGIIIAFLKSKEAANFAGALGLAGIRKGTEAKAEILRLTPEDKKALVKELAQEVIIGVKQEEKVVAKHPGMDPNKLDIPREKHDTKPAI